MSDLPAISPRIEARARRAAIIDLSWRLLGLAPTDPGAAVVADWLMTASAEVKASPRVGYVLMAPGHVLPAWRFYVDPVLADEALEAAQGS